MGWGPRRLSVLRAVRGQAVGRTLARSGVRRRQSAVSSWHRRQAHLARRQNGKPRTIIDIEQAAKLMVREGPLRFAVQNRLNSSYNPETGSVEAAALFVGTLGAGKH